VHFGTSSLSIGAGVDPTTVAKHFRDLREEPDGLITVILDNRGGGGLYELTIPGRTSTGPAGRDRRAGKSHPTQRTAESYQLIPRPYTEELRARDGSNCCASVVVGAIDLARLDRDRERTALITA
jgi:hypothetical protein